MNLPFSTIDALSRLSTVSRSVIVRGDQAFAFDDEADIQAVAKIRTPFPRDIAFRDIEQLLARLIQLGDDRANLEVNDKSCTITSPDGSRWNVATSKTLLGDLPRRVASRRRGEATTLHHFTFPHDAVRLWQAAISKVIKGKGKGAFRMLVESDGVDASLVLQNDLFTRGGDPTTIPREGGFGSFRLRIGKCRTAFSFGSNPAALSALPPNDDYDGVVVARTKGGGLSLSSKTRPISYTFGLSVSTVETAGRTKPRKR